jgi:hypothetical protein
MKTALKVLAALVVILFGGAVGVSWYFAHGARQKMKGAQQTLAARWAAVEPQFRADTARWKEDPLIKRHEGGNAGPVVFAHIRWDGDDKAAPPVSQALKDQLGVADNAWPGNAAMVDVKGIDTAWMSALGGFGFLDIEAEGSHLKDAPFLPLSDPMPNFIDLLQLAKVHLTQGLQNGDARPAARDVREVSRLCLTTENLLGEMIGVALVGLERRVYEDAVRRGHDVSGWTAVSKEDQLSLKRVLWAAPAPFSMGASGSLAAMTPEVGYCTGLREAVGTSHFLRRYIEPELPEHYARLTKALDASPCRLRRARAAWKANDPTGQLPDKGAALCQGDPTKPPATDCPFPDWTVRFPFVRAFIGDTLVAIAAQDWFKRYDDKE